MSTRRARCRPSSACGASDWIVLRAWIPAVVAAMGDKSCLVAAAIDQAITLRSPTATIIPCDRGNPVGAAATCPNGRWPSSEHPRTDAAVPIRRSPLSYPSITESHCFDASAGGLHRSRGRGAACPGPADQEQTIFMRQFGEESLRTHHLNRGAQRTPDSQICTGDRRRKPS